MIVSFASPLSYFTELRPLSLDVSGGRHRPRPLDGHRAAAETITGKEIYHYLVCVLYS